MFLLIKESTNFGVMFPIISVLSTLLLENSFIFVKYGKVIILSLMRLIRHNEVASIIKVEDIDSDTSDDG